MNILATASVLILKRMDGNMRYNVQRAALALTDMRLIRARYSSNSSLNSAALSYAKFTQLKFIELPKQSSPRLQGQSL